MIKSLQNVSDKVGWMPCPDFNIDTPGLAYICALEELIVAKQRDALHDLISSKSTGYTIFNNQGQKLFLAVLEKRCRKLDVKIFNHYGNEVIQVKTPEKTILNRVLVWAPPGNFLGVVKQVRSCVNKFIVKNWYGFVLYTIRAEGCNYAYKIFWDNEQVGEIAKRIDSTKVKRFGLSFSEEISVVDKAILLGAAFLIACLKY